MVCVAGLHRNVDERLPVVSFNHPNVLPGVAIRVQPESLERDVVRDRPPGGCVHEGGASRAVGVVKLIGWSRNPQVGRVGEIRSCPWPTVVVDDAVVPCEMQLPLLHEIELVETRRWVAI